MIQEIPYAEYSKTNDLNDSSESNNLPISIEIIPHKAIIDNRAQIIYSNEMNNRNRNEIIYIRSLIIITLCVVLILVLSSVHI
jgi:hypothetical protein